MPSQIVRQEPKLSQETKHVPPLEQLTSKYPLLRGALTAQVALVPQLTFTTLRSPAWAVTLHDASQLSEHGDWSHMNEQLSSSGSSIQSSNPPAPAAPPFCSPPQPPSPPSDETPPLPFMAPVPPLAEGSPPLATRPSSPPEPSAPEPSAPEPSPPVPKASRSCKSNPRCPHATPPTSKSPPLILRWRIPTLFTFLPWPPKSVRVAHSMVNPRPSIKARVKLALSRAR